MSVFSTTTLVPALQHLWATQWPLLLPLLAASVMFIGLSTVGWLRYLSAGKRTPKTPRPAIKTRCIQLSYMLLTVLIFPYLPQPMLLVIACVIFCVACLCKQIRLGKVWVAASLAALSLALTSVALPAWLYRGQPLTPLLALKTSLMAMPCAFIGSLFIQLVIRYGNASFRQAYAHPDPEVPSPST